MSAISHEQREVGHFQQDAINELYAGRDAVLVGYHDVLGLGVRGGRTKTQAIGAWNRSLTSDSSASSDWTHTTRLYPTRLPMYELAIPQYSFERNAYIRRGSAALDLMSIVATYDWHRRDGKQVFSPSIFATWQAVVLGKLGVNLSDDREVDTELFRKFDDLQTEIDTTRDAQMQAEIERITVARQQQLAAAALWKQELENSMYPQRGQFPVPKAVEQLTLEMVYDPSHEMGSDDDYVGVIDFERAASDLGKKEGIGKRVFRGIVEHIACQEEAAKRDRILKGLLNKDNFWDLSATYVTVQRAADIFDRAKYGKIHAIGQEGRRVLSMVVCDADYNPTIWDQY